jgi:hypothetical protein
MGGVDSPALRRLRLKSFNLRSGLDASNNASSMPPIFSQAEGDQWQEREREHSHGVAYSRRRRSVDTVAEVRSSKMVPIGHAARAVAGRRDGAGRTHRLR